MFIERFQKFRHAAETWRSRKMILSSNFVYDAGYYSLPGQNCYFASLPLRILISRMRLNFSESTNLKCILWQKIPLRKRGNCLRMQRREGQFPLALCYLFDTFSIYLFFILPTICEMKFLKVVFASRFRRLNVTLEFFDIQCWQRLIQHTEEYLCRVLNKHENKYFGMSEHYRFQDNRKMITLR